MINDRLALLRKEMKREGLSAFIFLSTDPHNGEWVPEHWEGRKWISGFTGSAGTAVVTMTSAALWTDSRYFLQAADELRDTEYVLMKERIAGTPTITEWLTTELKTMSESDGLRSLFGASRGHEVGIDGTTATASYVEALKGELRHAGGVTLRTNLDILSRIWHDRPTLPLDAIVPHPIEYTGREATEKLTMVRQALRDLHAEGMLVAQLEDIAWVLNLRGSDIHCIPVFVSYLLLEGDRTTLFTDLRKIKAYKPNGTNEANGANGANEPHTPHTPHTPYAYLQSIGVEVRDYSDIKEALYRYREYNILMDPDEINYTLFRVPQCKEVVRQKSPIPSLRAVKTEAEQEGFRRAMTRDGVALVRFQRWLTEAMARGERVTEVGIAEKLYALRAEQPLFRGTSFDTIAGYGAHGAIVHYEATAATDIPLEPHGFVLIDSGAQYLDGTTDITRTIPLGPLSDEERKVYTLVLKGHIQLQMLHFPDGASGTQLDAIARHDMWAHGYNYLHGTGHGVGSYLCCHEGPHQIRMECRPAPLHAGMTVTDEPGVYVVGRFGVRIENTLLTRHAEDTAYGTFLEFETLTLCPIDTAPIVLSLMTPAEFQWLNAYHRRVYDTLSPLLSTEDRQWLRKATMAL